MTVTFALPPALEAHEPAEARGRSRADVRLLVSRTASESISSHSFTGLPDLLLPGDLLVVNNSATLPAAVAIGNGLSVHFSTAMPAGDWLIELRSGREGHPSYRAVAHEMHAQISAVHPAVGALMTHVDRETEPRLERILSEMRSHARAGAGA